MINMSDAEKPNVEENIEKKIIENIRDWDITDSYLYFRNYIPKNSVEEYIAKKKCVEIGKELLSMDKDEKKQLEIDKIYEDACNTLNTAMPKTHSITYDFEDFGEGKVAPVYNIKADDAHETKTKQEELDNVLQDFIEQQYASHIKALQTVDNKIFHQLIKHKIIKTRIPTINEMIDDMIKTGIKSSEE